MEEHGVVVENKGATVLIKTERKSACESCSSSKSCHSISETEMLIEADNPVGADVGDMVVYEIGAGSVIKAGMLLYLVPLLSFILGVVVGESASERFFAEHNPDLVDGLSGVLFLGAAFIGLKLYGRRLERDKAYRPHVLKVV
jgi:sigma-E factor negative regulatory protein RseC